MSRPKKTGSDERSALEHLVMRLTAIQDIVPSQLREIASDLREVSFNEEADQLEHTADELALKLKKKLS